MSLIGGIMGIGRAAWSIFGRKAVSMLARSTPLAAKAIGFLGGGEKLMDIVDTGIGLLKDVYQRHMQNQGKAQDKGHVDKAHNIGYDAAMNIYNQYKDSQRDWQSYNKQHKQKDSDAKMDEGQQQSY